MTLKVKDIMTKDVKTSDVDESLVDAAKKMREFHISCVVVTKKNEAVGIVTTKDIVRKAIAVGKNLKKTKVKDIMGSPLIVVEAETTLQDAAKLMADNGIKKLPVVTPENELVGILTATDLLANAPEIVNVLINLDMGRKEQEFIGS